MRQFFKIRKMIKIVSALCFLLLVYADISVMDANAGQKTARQIIYVSEKGNDRASGNRKHPLKSLQKAMDRASAGTVIYLREGTYKGPFVFHKSGNRKGGHITVSAYKNERVMITEPKKTTAVAFQMNGCSYIRIEKLQIGNIDAEDACGIRMQQSEHHITIRNCEFKNINTTQPGNALTPKGGANAVLLLGKQKKSIHHIYILNNKVHDNVNGWSENISVAGNCEYIYVKKNKVYNNTNIGIDFYGNAEYCREPLLDQPRNCECTQNTVYNCKSPFSENAGIYIDGGRDILVKGNKVYKNPYGIEVGSEEWRSYYTDSNCVRNIKIKKNMIYDNQLCGLRIGGWTNDEKTGVVCQCEVIKNNFSRGNPGNDIILSKCDGILFQGNLFRNKKNCRKAITYDDAVSRSKIRNILFE